MCWFREESSWQGGEACKMSTSPSSGSFPHSGLPAVPCFLASIAAHYFTMTEAVNLASLHLWWHNDTVIDFEKEGDSHAVLWSAAFEAYSFAPVGQAV